MMVPEPLALELVLETLEDCPNFCDLLLCLNVICTVRLDPFILNAGDGKPVKKENDAFRMYSYVSTGLSSSNNQLQVAYMTTNTFTMRSRLSFSVSSSFRNSSNASNIASCDVIDFSLAICAPISLAIAYQKQGEMEDRREETANRERDRRQTYVHPQKAMFFRDLRALRTTVFSCQAIVLTSIS